MILSQLKRHCPRSVVSLLFLVSSSLSVAVAQTAQGNNRNNNPIRINEISDKGTAGVVGDICNGNDWIELYYYENDDGSSSSNGTDGLDLSGYVLHDDKGPSDSDAFVFPSSTMIGSGEYLVLCANDDTAVPFGIGGTDSVTLLDPSGSVVSTTDGALAGLGSDTVTLAFFDQINNSSNNNQEASSQSQHYLYTSTPTPGSANVLDPVVDPVKALREKLAARNELGVNFFNMDNQGLPVPGGLPDVVDLHMTVDQSKWEQMQREQHFEIYTEFLSATVTANVTSDDDNSSNAPTTVVLANLTSPGRFRPKGQSTLSIGVCMNRTVPYAIDWDRTDANQTLFGMTRSYLRTHVFDTSGTREWAAHRMLARFGLPFLRTRTVRYFVNGNYVGLYELMEVPEEEYVFARSFPTFDGSDYGLYKVKSLTLNCADDESMLGITDNETMAFLESMMVDVKEMEKDITEKYSNSSYDGPMSFEKGTHRDDVPALLSFDQCMGSFFQTIIKDMMEVQIVRKLSGETCGEFLVDHGLLDRDLGGSKKMDEEMVNFYDEDLGPCTDESCSNSNLPYDADVDDLLKNLAFMAAVLHWDSPLGNGNNYYLARASGEDPAWKLFQYDHNGMMSSGLCDQACGSELVHWSLARPTCRGLESMPMVGPLLTNPEWHARYLDYVREFHRDVMTNEDFLQQIQDHLVAIQGPSAEDPWWPEKAPLFSLELSSGDDWSLPGTNPMGMNPLMPTLRARAADIQKQLDALDQGTVPRPLEDIESSEVCVNWESPEARKAPEGCPQNCMYDGCHRPELTIPSYCDVNEGTCVHGILDDRCSGLANLASYDGMEGFDGSDRPPFCWNVEGVGPMKMAECPPFEGDDDSSNDSDSIDETLTEEDVKKEDNSSAASSLVGFPILVLLLPMLFA